MLWWARIRASLSFWTERHWMWHCVSAGRPQVIPRCLGLPPATLERAVLRHIRVKKRLPVRAPPLPMKPSARRC